MIVHWHVPITLARSKLSAETQWMSRTQGDLGNLDPPVLERADHLLNAMNDKRLGQLESGEGRATIVDVARRAGVSKSTVSLVLGGSALVAEATRERVSDAMSELGYIYHRGAATLRGAKSGVLGMVINDLSIPSTSSWRLVSSRPAKEPALFRFSPTQARTRFASNR